MLMQAQASQASPQASWASWQAQQAQQAWQAQQASKPASLACNHLINIELNNLEKPRFAFLLVVFMKLINGDRKDICLYIRFKQ